MSTRGVGRVGFIDISSDDQSAAMKDPHHRTGMVPPWEEEERIARSLKKYRRKMKRKERWQRLENQSPWEAYIESRFKGVCIVLGACIIIGIGLAITRLWTHP